MTDIRSNNDDDDTVAYRRNSYQRENPTESSSPGTSSGLPQRRRSSSQRRSRSSRRSLIMVLRQAFNIDYEPTELQDNDEADVFTDNDSEEGMLPATASRTSYNNNANPRYGRYLVGLLCVVAILIAAPLVSKDRRTGQAALPGGKHRPASSPTSDNVLGTCRDPIYQYESTSSKQGLEHGAVASDHPLCSAMGTTILRDAGGNAADAAVTIALCLGVANPASSGIGGGGFILVHADDPLTAPSSSAGKSTEPAFRDEREPSVQVTADSGKITEVIDCREVAPAAATTNMFLDATNDRASTLGGLAAGVPAELKGLELLHARHGRLPWSQVVAPVVKLAKQGVSINGNLAHEIDLAASAYTAYAVDDPAYGLRRLVTHNDDWRQPLQEGELLHNPKLAKTLEAIMKEGSRALYSGVRAEGLARDIANAGGIITQQDIENYVPTLRSPVVSHDIQGFSIAGVPPPSSGGAAIVAIARFLAGYATPYAAFADTLSVHRFVEACRHVFAMRMSLSDPDYNSEVVRNVVRDMTLGSYITYLRNMTLDNTTLPLSRYGGTNWAQLNDTDGDGDVEDAKEGDRRRRQLWRKFGYLEDHGTSHFSVVDESGNAVSMTTSVNMYFGSNIVSESTGIIVNNQMDDFSTPGKPNGFGLAPAESNYILPGKRPLSSMSPTFLFRRSETKPDNSFGKLVLVLGASGGPKIITAVLQVILNHIFLGMPLFQATIQARVHEQLLYHGASVTTVEKSVLQTGEPITVNDRTVSALKSRNHDLLEIDYTGTVQAISVDLETDLLSATCDIRKGGSPDGY